MAQQKPFIGQMDRKIEVYKTSKIPNEISEHKETDVLVSLPWAQAIDGTANVQVEGAIKTISQRVYRIRFNKAIAETGVEMHVIDRARRYNIVAVKEIGRSHLELTTTTVE